MGHKSKKALQEFLEVIGNAENTFLNPEKNLDEQGKIDGYGEPDQHGNDQAEELSARTTA